MTGLSPRPGRGETMRLAVNVTAAHGVLLAQEAERLGFSDVFVPEGVRGDAITVLASIAAQTRRIGLASGVCQVPARPPTSMALACATLDQLSSGRFRLGLGISNAHVTENWYGQPFAEPLTRMREYVEIVRMALRREPVIFHGSHFSLPRAGRPGTPLVVPGQPVRADLPVFLAALGERSLRLAGQIADGWLGTFVSPDTVIKSLELVRAGRSRAGADLAGFDAIASVPLNVTDDLDQAARPIAAYVAMFVGMGPARENPYFRLLSAQGYPAEAAAIHRLAAAGDWAGAAAAVPGQFVDEMSLLGPVERIAERIQAFAAAGITTLAVSPHGSTPEERVAGLRAAARALDLAGVGG